MKAAIWTLFGKLSINPLPEVERLLSANGISVTGEKDFMTKNGI